MPAVTYRSLKIVSALLLTIVVLAGCGGAPAVPSSSAGQSVATTAATAAVEAQAVGAATTDATAAPTDAMTSVTETSAATTGATDTAVATETSATETAAAAETSAATAAAPAGTSTAQAFDPSGADLVVYSGRSKNLVGPLIERFQKETGSKVAVRYGDTAELAATILEEGANSPADVFFSQDAGALGALSKADLLTPLPGSILEQVPARFRSSEQMWVGISGRARTVVYNTAALKPADLPASIRGLSDPAWKGKIGWAPTNASFQAFVTAMRQLDGDDKTREWLKAVQANEPRAYKNNAAVVEAVAAGEVQVGLVNHYYVMQLIKQKGESYGARNHFFSGGDVGSLVNVAGAAILKTSNDKPAAEEFINFLLNNESQQYFSSETFEYPVVQGVAANSGLPALDQIETPVLDLSKLEDLEGTLELLREVGIL